MPADTIAKERKHGPGMGSERLAALQARVLGLARECDYSGYSKHDALNARWLEALAGGSRIRRLLLTQLVMRAPFHVRPALGVKTARNAKGLALFSRALLSRHRILGDQEAGHEARRLLDWLIENASEDFEGYGWGYPYPWQDVGFFAPRGYPNRVVTSFVTQALMDGYESLGDANYLEAAEKAVAFLLKAPRTLHEDSRHRCVSYVPNESVSWIVMDVSALVGAAAARLAAIMDDADLMGEAGRLVRYVVSKQTDYGAWYYAEPPGDSHIRHDNYHTGFILDAILEYGHFSGSGEFDTSYDRGLRYYRDHLFEADGAPRFMNDQKYPFDIHGAAQGIITFALAQRRRGWSGEFSSKVLDWTISNMYDAETGWFSYQKRPLISSRIRLLRWCQAWMAFAIGRYLETSVES